MEFTTSAVANKMILIIALLSILIALGGLGFYYFTNDIAGAIPFAVGAAVGCGVNILKVLWLKRDVNRAVAMESYAATVHLKSQYFIRLMLTLAVLVAGGFMHQAGYVNLIGLSIALLATMPIASYSMQFFIPKDEHTEALTNSLATKSNSTQDAIDEINAIASKSAE